MLSLPSTPPSAPPAAYRPTLAADAVRSVSPLRALEPPEAISKERSRAENQTPPGVVVAPGVEQLQRLVATQSPSASLGLTPNNDPAPPNLATPPKAANQPPAEKTEIQKALDVQIRDLLVNVWKASAKAVDFLLNRQEASAEAADALTPPTPSAVPGKKSGRVTVSSLQVDARDAGAQQAIQSYTASGSAAPESGRATGRIVNLSA